MAFSTRTLTTRVLQMVAARDRPVDRKETGLSLGTERQATLIGAVLLVLAPVRCLSLRSLAAWLVRLVQVEPSASQVLESLLVQASHLCLPGCSRAEQAGPQALQTTHLRVAVILTQPEQLLDMVPRQALEAQRNGPPIKPELCGVSGNRSTRMRRLVCPGGKWADSLLP